MSKPADRFARVPQRFYDALASGEVSHRQFVLGCYLAGQVDYVTGKAALTLKALADGLDWPWSDETLRKDLLGMRPQWIEYEVRQGQRSRYVFRLTGLQVGGHLQRQRGAPVEVTSNQPDEALPANPPPQPKTAADKPPTAKGHNNRPEQTRGEKQNLGSEEELDHGVGETTATDPGVTARLLEKLDGLSSKTGAFKAKTGATPGGDSNGSGAPRVAVTSEGFNWTDEASEGEQATVDDLQALVAAGVLTEGESEPPVCRYPAHRGEGRDWRNDAGRLMCGVCHPRAKGRRP